MRRVQGPGERFTFLCFVFDLRESESEEEVGVPPLGDEESFEVLKGEW